METEHVLSLELRQRATNQGPGNYVVKLLSTRMIWPNTATAAPRIVFYWGLIHEPELSWGPSQGIARI